MGLIDFHAHLAPSPAGRERLLASMALSGIATTVVVAGGLLPPQELSRRLSGGTGGNVATYNGELLSLTAGSGGKLLPFFFANPFDSPDGYARLGHRFHGLKLGPAVHGVALADDRNAAYVRLAGDFSHPVYLHCLPRHGFDVPALVSLARDFPSVIFVLGHAGVGHCDFDGVDRVRDFPNIYFETSGGFSSVVAYAIQKLGVDRILFGSEYPLQDPAIELLKVRLLGLSPRMLNANALRVLGQEVRGA